MDGLCCRGPWRLQQRDRRGADDAVSLCEIRFIERRQLLAGVIQRPVGNQVLELARVGHNAQVVRLAVVVVAAAVTEPERVPELVHEGPGPQLLVADAILVNGRPPEAADRYDEVVPRDLGATGRAGTGDRVAGQGVDGEPVAKRQLLRR